MAKKDLATATQELYALLNALGTPEDRQKVITAAMTLVGEAHHNPTGAGQGSKTETFGLPPAPGSSGASSGGNPTARQFFDQKQPKGKTEELAVAAYYREHFVQSGAANTRDDFQAVIKTGAKRAFDDRHYARDLANAKTAKLINTGKENQISYIGEKFVDALPDRKAAAATRKSTRSSKKKRVTTKKKGA